MTIQLNGTYIANTVKDLLVSYHHFVPEGDEGHESKVNCWCQPKVYRQPGATVVVIHQVPSRQ